MVAGTRQWVEQALAWVATDYLQLLSTHEGRSACIEAVENWLPTPRAQADRVAACAGDVKHLRRIDLLVT